MKRLLMMLFACAVCFTSCSKDDDDKLEGKWQLRQIETEGQTIKIDTVFYNFQNALFMYQIYVPATKATHHCYGYKDIEGDKQLVLELVESENFLQYTDWNSTKETFTIEKLTGSQLILNRDNKRYIFRKF